MARAYLKINVKPGEERNVKEAVLKISGIKHADLTAGDQDIIALVEASTYDDILDLVLNKLRTINGVEKTVTNLITE